VVLLLGAAAASKLSTSGGKGSRIPCNYKGKTAQAANKQNQNGHAIMPAQFPFALEYNDTVGIQ
jgi:hypothetical protein